MDSISKFYEYEFHLHSLYAQHPLFSTLLPGQERGERHRLVSSSMCVANRIVPAPRTRRMEKQAKARGNGLVISAVELRLAVFRSVK